MIWMSLTKSIYELELIEIMKVWAFNFLCANCSTGEREPAWFRYVSPMISEDAKEGTYSNSPTIWCGCNEMLYSVQSHGLYDLLDDLFPRDDSKKYIMIKLREPTVEEEQEPFVYSMDDRT